ncbi:protein of unknown function DUF395, YeeE/YedE (plasmid) [Nitrobacter hamburgensis X14]|uniref:YeeE/YedE family protein n=1 Tax=Nitrobacter hamburgensis (strain DSM 10229 / NCIMB 13809 / X14) TaxID=323097 RepID=Q1QF13_NITHX|nr:DUF6691 family protein [Nitrobacter hamburgensis]ABE65184.1 protein of unknown function DUF395, YeeE/YedE [Nitrobacter hamburgensis X14]
MQVLISLAAGLIFGLGLIISQMINPEKVLAFLDVAGDWDPSLAFVLAGAAAVSGLGYFFSRRRSAPLLAAQFDIPDRRDLDARLIIGAAFFGVGWGLVGLCPGPAIVALPLVGLQGVLFFAAMLIGMGAFTLLPSAVAPSSSHSPALDADA